MNRTYSGPMRARGSSPAPGAAESVARVIAAVHERSRPGVQAGELARALGRCLDAASVTIILTDTGRQYSWSAGAVSDDQETVPVRQSDRGPVLAELSVAPGAAAQQLRHWPELLAVLQLLLSGIHAQLAAADAATVIGRSAAGLGDARMRAAGQMEQQRYQLERDLHDGAQHHMVALQMALAMVEHQLGERNPGEAARHIDRLRHLLASTEEVLHTTATGLLSLPLADHGLVAALTARLGSLETLTLDIDPVLTNRRYPSEVEATVYLACLEAVSNAYKHAPGATVTLALRTSAAGLTFEVTDTGPGFDTGGRMPLHYLAERLASVGGTLTVRSAPGEGTRVSGAVAI